MTRSAFLRARRPEHKQQRREAILTAARELALSSGVRNVSLGAVAEAVGLAKSNIMRYFGSREEIYLELAGEEWAGWAEAVVTRLHDTAQQDGVARKGDLSRESSRKGDPSEAAGRVGGVVAALTETIADRPLLCDLISHSATSLEHNVSVPAARAYKRAAHSVVAELGAAVGPACGLTESEGAELVSAAVTVAGILYPISNPPPTIVELYAQDPDLAASCPQFLPTMTRMLQALAIGLPALRQADRE
ncbi:TetR family transcriptional regulator [Nonomuraea sp. NPDC002799]